MRIERWTGPPVDTHTYLVADEASGEAWVIDAPQETAAAVLARVQGQGLRLSRAILTHGHFDHVLDAGKYAGGGIPIAAHPREQQVLSYPQTLLMGMTEQMPRITITEELREGNQLRLGESEWLVMHLPGHSPGHIVLYCAEQHTLLGGDMLFRGGYGRVDFPGCDPVEMAQSLLRLLELPDETRVLPGHGPETTVGAERVWLEPLLADPAGAVL